MLVVLQILAAAVPAIHRFGRLQLPVFGLMATAGLLAALALSQRTAPLAGLDPQRLWDAGVLAVVSAFAASRLLLAAVNLRLFLAHPLLVLAQPSLTFGGLAFTAWIVWLWLRRHALPLPRVLDAFAAPAALLAAVLQLGHFVEGTDAGMPTTLPWGVHTPSDLTFARVHPVQLYAATGYVVLCVWLLHAASKSEIPVDGQPAGLRKVWAHPDCPGSIAALGLLAGGILSFSLSFLRQPYDALGDAWLDPGQYAALAAVVAGIVLFAIAAPQPNPLIATYAHFPAEEPC